MRFFTSDTHYGHWAMLTGKEIVHQDRSYKVLGPRVKYWKDVKEMDEAILGACNKYVKRADTLYHLGDFGFVDKLGSYRQQIVCKDIRIIWGNHDKRLQVKPLVRFAWESRMISLREHHC